MPDVANRIGNQKEETWPKRGQKWRRYVIKKNPREQSSFLAVTFEGLQKLVKRNFFEKNQDARINGRIYTEHKCYNWFKKGTPFGNYIRDEFQLENTMKVTGKS